MIIVEKMKLFVKQKEEEKKIGKARSVKSAKPGKVQEKKGKPERVTTPKHKTKLEIKDKPAPHKIDKLNQTAKHAENKKFKFGEEK